MKCWWSADEVLMKCWWRADENYHRLPQTTTDYHRLPQTATDCHWLIGCTPLNTQTYLRDGMVYISYYKSTASGANSGAKNTNKFFGELLKNIHILYIYYMYTPGWCQIHLKYCNSRVLQHGGEVERDELGGGRGWGGWHWGGGQLLFGFHEHCLLEPLDARAINPKHWFLNIALLKHCRFW